MSHTQIKQHDWQDDNGLCSFCTGGHCLMGCFCPCMLVNKTAELIDDPEEKTPSGCGAMGCAWCIINSCGVGFIISCLQRGKIRSKHGIEGGTCGDGCINLCCPCCSVIQQYKELEIRRDARVNTKGYQGQAPMRH